MTANNSSNQQRHWPFEVQQCDDPSEHPLSRDAMMNGSNWVALHRFNHLLKNQESLNSAEHLEMFLVKHLLLLDLLYAF